MRLPRALPWLALYLCAGFSCLVEGGFLAKAVAPDLARLPDRLGPIEVLEELPLELEALGREPPECATFRRVRDAAGHEGRLFIAYYARAQRWSGRPHDLEKCYAALGWQEREARRIGAGGPWSRSFEKPGEDGTSESIRVIHWLERPGAGDERLSPGELVARLGSLRGFRPDVASVYLEFPADAAPDEGDCAAAARSIAEAIDALW